MSDEVDDAQRHIDAELEALLARHRARMPHAPAPVADRCCRVCCEWIGMERLGAVPHAVLCIECATVLEHRHKQGRGRP